MKKADSQIGFLKFVIRPTFLLLGEIVPKVKVDVIPIIDSNINYWTREKQRLSLAGSMNSLSLVSGMKVSSRHKFTTKESIEEDPGAEENDESSSSESVDNNDAFAANESGTSHFMEDYVLEDTSETSETHVDLSNSEKNKRQGKEKI